MCKSLTRIDSGMLLGLWSRLLLWVSRGSHTGVSEVRLMWVRLVLHVDLHLPPVRVLIMKNRLAIWRGSMR